MQDDIIIDTVCCHSDVACDFNCAVVSREVCLLSPLVLFGGFTILAVQINCGSDVVSARAVGVDRDAVELQGFSVFDTNDAKGVGAHAGGRHIQLAHMAAGVL